MANSLSAKKRIKQNEQARVRNRARKAVVKTATRKLSDAIHAGDTAAAESAFLVVQKELDQTGAKGVLHKNTVARRKSRLAKQVNALRSAKSA